MFTTVVVSESVAGLPNRDDSPFLAPVPVHLACWETRGIAGGYQRRQGAVKFVVDGKWVMSLPRGAICFLCNKIIY